MSESKRAWGEPIRHLSFSSDCLPAQLDDRARYEAWRELFLPAYVPIEIDRLQDRPFRQYFQCNRFGATVVGKFGGTMHRIVRTRRAVATFTNDDLVITFNVGPSPTIVTNAGRSTELSMGMFTMLDNVHTGEMLSKGENAAAQVLLLGRALRDMIPYPEDFLAQSLDPFNPVVRHLRRYIGILLEDDDLGDERDLAAHVGTTLTDLVALALGAGRDAAAIGSARGLRAARLQIALAEIRRSYADPAFSPESLAHKLGLSVRTLQDLLQQTGTSFTERVLEQRLQAARSMLVNSSRYGGLGISEIAAECGFGDVSYFNRVFRRRFGDTPGSFRRG